MTPEAMARVSRLPRLDQVFDVVSPRSAKATTDASRRLAELGIPHALIGGLAVGAYGHPRATQDVDFLLSERGVERADPMVVFKPGTPFSAHGVRIDYLVPADEFLNDAVAHAHVVDGVPVIEVGPLVHLKLRAGRRQDLADVEALVRAGIDVAAVSAYLGRHGTDEMREEFAQIVVEADRA